jgi:hypothetical protein
MNAAVENTTNQRMELLAACVALERTEGDIEIRSDRSGSLAGRGSPRSWRSAGGRLRIGADTIGCGLVRLTGFDPAVFVF